MTTAKGRIAVLVLGLLAASGAALSESLRYVRYAHTDGVSYGIQRENVVEELSAAPFAGGEPTGATHRLADVQLLAPAEPSKVIAVGYNYHSHRGDRELPPHPPIFLKLPTTIVGPGADIRYPQGATDLHYEAELVVVMGKRASQVSAEDAGDYIFGVTAGQRRERTCVASQRSSVVSRQSVRHVRTPGSGDRHRARLQRPAGAVTLERRGDAVAKEPRSHP